MRRNGTINQQMTSVRNIDPIINVFEKKKKIKRVKMIGWKKIIVTNLFFSYQNKKDFYNLKNINLEIKKGEKIAFVGENGSGKSTMLMIIKSLYHSKGEIYLDEIKLKDYFKGISYKIALIPQEAELFKNTIKHNITLGVKYRKEHIEKLVKITNFDKTLEKFPEKYEKNIGEKGSNLSGGEKQKLALTRGLLASKEKEIILLDEPTSKIDPKNELEIYKNILEEFKEKTIISTVHRLHLLKLFDKIVFFEKGKIVAAGNLEEVLKNENFYEMWKKNSF
ncbi:MAG: ATP-binding cassette domain-containing protein [Candidatus ainarchaeum sp.]|nr:ATP-binding cassette domain-containing protein [Candidatus ainarchaeum sp.]